MRAAKINFIEFNFSTNFHGVYLVLFLVSFAVFGLTFALLYFHSHFCRIANLGDFVVVLLPLGRLNKFRFKRFRHTPYTKGVAEGVAEGEGEGRCSNSQIANDNKINKRFAASSKENATDAD